MNVAVIKKIPLLFKDPRVFVVQLVTGWIIKLLRKRIIKLLKLLFWTILFKRLKNPVLKFFANILRGKTC